MLPKATDVTKSGTPPEDLGVQKPSLEPNRKRSRESMAKKSLSDTIDGIANGDVKMEPDGWLGPLEDFDQVEVAEDPRVFVHLQQVYYTRGTSSAHGVTAGRLLAFLERASVAIGGTITHVY